MSYLILPIFIVTILFFALINKVNAYEAFIKGALNGIKTAIEILPFFLAMIMASKIFSSSRILLDLINSDHIPVELLMQGFFRPISSSGSLSLMLEIYNEYGVDSKMGIVSSILQGSSDTTLYVVTLYFGSINLVKYRHALKLGLVIDMIAILLALFFYFFIF